jgi:hypothetical protein
LQICIASSLLVGAANAAVVQIQNGSFELNDIANGAAAATNSSNVPGWVGASTFLVDNDVTQNKWFNTAVPDGQQALSLYNGYIGQYLKYDDGSYVMTSTTMPLQFTVTFYIGDRIGNGFGTGAVRTGLQFATTTTGVGGTDFSTPVRKDINLGPIISGDGMWSGLQTATLTVPVDTTSHYLFLFFNQAGAGGGPEAAIDNVAATLVTVPEPSAWLSLLGGCGVLLGLRRRRH